MTRMTSVHHTLAPEPCNAKQEPILYEYLRRFEEKVVDLERLVESLRHAHQRISGETLPPVEPQSETPANTTAGLVRFEWLLSRQRNVVEDLADVASQFDKIA